MIYPWPQRPPGLIDEAFTELARRWRPLLDLARDKGCVLGYELHPGSDLFDGATFERFLEHTQQHPSAGINYDPSHLLLQQLDYLEFIEITARISGRVKDAEFRPTGRVGGMALSALVKRRDVFGLGRRPGRFSPGVHAADGSGLQRWAVLEWERTKGTGAAEVPYSRGT
jgi:sugar phosphate isomerase/epimerase